MRFSVTKKLVTGFGLAFAILCIISVARFQNTTGLIEDMGLVARSYRVLAELGDVSELVRDVQSAVRGYVISSNDSFLEPYRTAREEIRQQIEEVETLIRGKPEIIRRFSVVKSLVEEQLAYSAQTIEMLQKQGQAVAMERVRSGAGDRLLSNIRQTVHETEDVEERLLAERNAEAARSTRQTLAVGIVGSVLALLTVGVAILVIVRDLRERMRLEEAVLNAAEKEQRRIGQDLHDGLCQQLAGIAFMSRALEGQLEGVSPKEAETAGRMSELLNRAVNHARGLARGLRPVELEADALMSALEELASDVSAFWEVNCRFKCARPVSVASNATAVHVYRIAQEAVHNAVRHGKPRNVDIILTGDDKTATIEIRDDGCGVPQDVGRLRGMGLDGMVYRANTIGAALAIKRIAEGGTAVVCKFPIGPETPIPI